MSREEWRPVIREEYPGFYEVSSIGRVKSLPRFNVRSERIFKGNVDTLGYPTATLSNGKKHSLVRVHVLVAEAFIGPRPSSDHQVNHINGVKTDNRVENLEWVTQTENMRHMFRTGLRKKNVLNEKYPEIFTRHEKGEMFKDLSKEYGIPTSTLSCAYMRHTGKAGTIGKGGYQTKKPVV